MDLPNAPKSAQQVFENNAVPVVRTIEKQLYTSIARDKEKLRALVGGNYRELLATAEEIVSLDEQSRAAEVQIAALSQQCKPPPLHLAFRPVSSFSSTSAQLRLLSQCIACIYQALQTRSVLVSAELLVVSRLLLKSLGEQPSVPQTADTWRRKHAAIQRRLVRLLNTQLAHPASDNDMLVDAICAYCLTTSTSSGDAIKHFREIRLDKLRQRLNGDAENQDQTQETFLYLISSVQSLKSLFSRSVNDALGSLQKNPILQSQSIRKLEALDTDRLHTLIPHDILTFTPFLKRVLLTQEEIRQISTEWVTEACQIYVDGLQKVLATMKSVGDVFALRQKLLSLILPAYFSTEAGNTLVNAVRQTTSACVMDLCRAQTQALVSVGQTIATGESDVALKSTLWDPSLALKSLAPNSAHYVRQVQSSHLGTTGSLMDCLRRMKIWARQMTQLRLEFQSLESSRWRDILEEPDDEDEDVADLLVSQLSQDDPRQFQKAMDLSLQDAISQFQRTLHEASSAIMTDNNNQDTIKNAATVVYLLRALRESSAILLASAPDSKPDNLELTSKLYDLLAEMTCARIVASLRSSTISHKVSPSSPTDLPSPQTFKMLRNICRTMADIGGNDIWSAEAVSHLKEKLCAKILERENRTAAIQTDFDECFARAALSSQRRTPKDTELANIQSQAEAYWQRCKLLFGALS